MGILSFVKEAGERLFGGASASPAPNAVASGGGHADAKTANDAAGEAIKNYIETQGLKATGLLVTYDGASGKVTVFGVAPDQQTREKIILCCGNVRNVDKVDDKMSVDQSAPEAQFYTVVKGDTLSKISKQCYGDPNKYTAIFEANKPMLKSPDLIYPGQVLRIPPQ